MKVLSRWDAVTVTKPGQFYGSIFSFSPSAFIDFSPTYIADSF